VKLVKTFSHNLNTIMVERDMSNRDLAKLCNTGTEWIRLVRMGKYNVRLTTVERIADALGVDAVGILEEWE